MKSSVHSLVLVSCFFHLTNAENICALVNATNIKMDCGKQDIGKQADDVRWSFFNGSRDGKVICSASQGSLFRGFTCVDGSLVLETVQLENAGRYMCLRFYGENFEPTYYNLYVILDSEPWCQLKINYTSIIMSITFRIAGGRAIDLTPIFMENGVLARHCSALTNAITNGTFLAECVFNYSSSSHKAVFTVNILGQNLSCSRSLPPPQETSDIWITLAAVPPSVVIFLFLVIFVGIIVYKKRSCFSRTTKDLPERISFIAGNEEVKVP